ncbi:MAG: hypothetical protein JXM70_30585 [Pirellulales bacterium]|nr:hypothetical protein [Pirellulales bacterium]
MSFTIRHYFRYIVFTICILCPVVLASAETKLFLLGGQSNMDGRPKTGNIPAPYDRPQTNVRIWDYFKGGGWKDLRAGFSESGKTYGPEVSFGASLKKAFPRDDIYIVKYANGGTNQAVQWNPNGTGGEYNKFKSAVEAAVKNLTNAGCKPKICGMIWMQGESDTLKHRYAVKYEKNLRNFISKVRDDFDTSDMPFVLGRIVTFYGDPADNALVRAAQVTVAKDTKNVAWIDTDDLSWKGAYDGHYGTEGQIILGRRFAAKILELLKPDAVGK